jgi:hypothetical protein
MVAGNGSGHGRASSVPKFDDSDFDGWVIFLKTFPMKYDRADLAFTDAMPMRDMDSREREEYPYYEDEEDGEAYQKKRERRLARDTVAYSYILESCTTHDANNIVKAYN